MTEPHLHVRPATVDDSPACASIYEYYVLNTPITFELDPPTAKQMGVRILTSLQTHDWLVLEQEDRLIGYAYATAYASRAAYDWTCETSVYLDKDFKGKGGGRLLYAELLDRLATRGFRQAIAGITMPNEASQGLHQAFGFEEIGTFKSVGWKFEKWHDVLRLQKPLATGATNPPSELR